ncbi:MAG TPA: IPT/TIG domain-containing protein, partial [Caldilineaceae bacterium]|nr:IPT/TIG domain-containing protein [Caldilineaceae bacterium]
MSSCLIKIVQPKISEVQPTAGRADEPHEIEILGKGFLAGARALLGETPLATTFVISTQLQAVVPTGLATGDYTLTVNNLDGGSASLPNAYTVLPGRPKITSVTPSVGRTDQATPITIVGNGFTAGAQASLGDTPLTTTFDSATQLRATAPSGLAPGNYALKVVNPNGENDTLNDAFAVRLPPPIIRDVQPNHGANDEPVEIVIVGEYFTAGVTVSLGPTLLTATFVDANYLRATVPAGLPPGKYDLAVTNENGVQVLSPKAYTVQPPPPKKPTINRVLPNQGSNAVENEITVVGNNFGAGALIRLGTIILTPTTFVAVDTIQSVVPAGLPAGVYDITVINPDGGMATLTNAYTVFDNANNDD